MKVLLYGPDYNRRHEVGWLTTYAVSVRALYTDRVNENGTWFEVLCG